MLGTHYSSLANELLEEGRAAISQQNNADTGTLVFLNISFYILSQYPS